ncbi:MAG: ribosome small subunit-dependent GTPase A [Bacteroidaceae bacterium]|nr:ribosome small subunit-dependent GTPase A [Bacteroidaceae bacterium]
MKGLVVRCTGSSCVVRTDDAGLVECRIKGNFRIKGIKSTNPVAVGDYVTITEPAGGEPSYITDIGERRNYIIRRSSNLSKQSHILACNLDMCVLVVTISHPETSTVFIDRFLATAQAYRVPVTILFNKSDLYDNAERAKADALCGLYEGIGYRCIQCDSLHCNEGIAALRALLKDKVTLISGNSGVGKTTLINCLLPDLNLKTGRISDKHDTGMHTTTFSEMFQLPEGGWIIDTPGVKGFGSFDMCQEEMSHYFPEIFACSKDCRYGNCTHINEPDCAVREAVEAGKINPSRYMSYLSMMEDESGNKYRSSR